jgi:hypothetical protein
MTISSAADYKNANLQEVKFLCSSFTTAAGNWVLANTNPSFQGPTLPATFSSGGTTFNASNTSLLGLPRITPISGTSAYIGKISAMFSTAAGTMHIYDVMWGASGFDTNNTSLQSVSSFSGMPSRNPNGANTELWFMCFSIPGSTASTITVKYTNSANVSNRTASSTTIGSMPVLRMFQIPLAVGDTGINSIQSMQFSPASGTSGNVGLIVMQRVTGFSSSVAGASVNLDAYSLGFPQIDAADSALWFINQSTSTSTGIIYGQMDIVQG